MEKHNNIAVFLPALYQDIQNPAVTKALLRDAEDAPMDSAVGKDPIRHINVKYRQPTSAIYRNQETLFRDCP